MNKYHNMTILKSVKQQIKVAMFYLLDIIIIGGFAYGLFLLQNYMKLPAVHFILLEIVSVLFGIFLCIKPASGGGSRNLFIAYKLLTMDRNTYVVQSYTKGVKKRGTN